MPYVIVLTDKPNEANTYAKRAGLRRGQYRYPTSASSIRGIRVAEIHELPSFSQRRDRHAIDAELRYARGERKLVQMPEAAPVDQGDGFGEQLTIDQISGSTIERGKIGAVALIRKSIEPNPVVNHDGPYVEEFKTVLEPEGWEPPESLNALQILALAGNTDSTKSGADVLAELEESQGEDVATTTEKKRRRSRCRGCGELDFAETHSCPVAMRGPATPESMFD